MIRVQYVCCAVSEVACLHSVECLRLLKLDSENAPTQHVQFVIVRVGLILYCFVSWCTYTFHVSYVRTVWA